MSSESSNFENQGLAQLRNPIPTRENPLIKAIERKNKSQLHPQNIEDVTMEISQQCSDNKTSLGLLLAAKHISIGDIATDAQQSRLLADAEVGRQLGMIKESIDPSHRNNTAQNHFDELLNTDKQMASRSTELEFRRNTFWKSCCDSVIDRRATVFFTQVAIGAIVIFFAMSKMWTSESYQCSGDDPSVYVGLISVILGWFVPAPSMK